MTKTEEFVQSLCDDPIEKRIISILRDNTLTNNEKIETIVKMMRESND